MPPISADCHCRLRLLIEFGPLISQIQQLLFMVPLTSDRRDFRCFLYGFASFPKNKNGTSFYDNSFIWSPFLPIQIALDSEWGDLCNETVSESSLWFSFSSDLQRICAIWHLLPLIWSLLDLEVYPGSIFGSRLPTKRNFGLQKTNILIWTVPESNNTLFFQPPYTCIA